MAPSTDAQLYRDPFLARMTDDGLQTGSSDATGDYSGAVTPFYATPPVGKVWLIQRVGIYLQDTGTFDPEGYAAGSALTNGIYFEVRRGTAVKIDLSNIKVYTNFDWNGFASRYAVDGAGQVTSVAIIELFNVVRLVGAEGDNYAVMLNDDFTGIDVQRFTLGGEVEGEFQ